MQFLGGTVSGTTARTAGPERGPTLLPERLVSGYEAFHGGRFTREQDRFRLLAEAGQKSRIMMIGCRDSRVSPEVIVDAEPGELIIARNDPAGAPLDDYIECLALASIVQGLAKLRTFPWIAKREQLGKLGLHGEPISASPRPRCSRSTGLAGASSRRGQGASRRLCPAGLIGLDRPN